LLARSNRPINQIAIETGFGSSASFGKAFRRLVGCTPSVFREDFRPGSLDT
jgi:AraC family transcriptional regulator